MELLNLEDEICPSCGFEKNVPGKPLCYYCYHRSTESTVKMFILKVLSEQKKHLTIEELIEKLNSHPINDGRKEFKYQAVWKTLNRISEPGYMLVNKKERKDKKAGRNKNEYSFNKRAGKRLLKEYEKRWLKGSLARVKKEEWLQNERMTNGYELSNKQSVIKKSIDEGKYGPYDYIFGNELKTNLKFHTKPP